MKKYTLRIVGTPLLILFSVRAPRQCLADNTVNCLLPAEPAVSAGGMGGGMMGSPGGDGGMQGPPPGGMGGPPPPGGRRKRQAQQATCVNTECEYYCITNRTQLLAQKLFATIQTM